MGIPEILPIAILSNVLPAIRLVPTFDNHSMQWIVEVCLEIWEATKSIAWASMLNWMDSTWIHVEEFRLFLNITQPRQILKPKFLTKIKFTDYEQITKWCRFLERIDTMLRHRPSQDWTMHYGSTNLLQKSNFATDTNASQSKLCLKDTFFRNS